MRPTHKFQVQFLQNMQRLLSEGQFVATYKNALLLALADISVEKGDDSGEALTTRIRLIAEKFITYYWRQAIPYLPRQIEAGATGGILRQNTAKQAAVIGQMKRSDASRGTL
jgi:hypothetical protein